MKKICISLIVILMISIVGTGVLADGSEAEFTIDGFGYLLQYDSCYGSSENYNYIQLNLESYNGETLVASDKLPNGLPGGLYIYQIIQAAGDQLNKEADFTAFGNQYIAIDHSCDSLHVFNASMTDVKVKVVQNGVANEVLFQDQKPLIINDRTMLPIRAVAEQLGWNVTWNDFRNEARISDGNKEVRVGFGVGDIAMIEIYSGGEYEKYVEGYEAIIANGRTLMPVRAVAEALGVTVDWNEAESCVVLTK